MDLSFENVKEIYSGKQGCMCGCRGIYKNESNATERSLKLLYRKVMSHDNMEYDTEANCAFISPKVGLSRNNVVYFK